MNPVSLLPTIDWPRYSSETFPALPPTSAVKTLPQLFCYWVSFVGLQKSSQDNKAGIAEFYEISTGAIDRIQEGSFIPPALGYFPVYEAGALLVHAHRLSDGYGKLMAHLLRQTAFNTYAWCSQLTESKDWEDWLTLKLQAHFIYLLLQDSVSKFLSPDHKTVLEIPERRELREVVTLQKQIQSTNWHSGRSRRDVLFPWIREMTKGDEAQIRGIIDFIGQSNRRRMGVSEEPPDPSDEVALIQWKLKHWFCFDQMGSLPLTRYVDQKQLGQFLRAKTIIQVNRAFLDAVSHEISA